MQKEFCNHPVFFDPKELYVSCPECLAVMDPDDVMVVDPDNGCWCCLDCADRRCKGPAASALEILRALTK